MDIKLLSWNCQSLQNKLYEMKNFMNDKLFHIIALQETWLNANNSFTFPNYNFVRSDRKSNSRNPHGGVALLVSKDIHFKVVKPVTLSSIEAIFINVTSGAFTFTLGSIYSPSSLKRSEAKEDLEKIFSIRGPLVLMGDWNAKHQSWNNVQSNGKGTDLKELALSRLFDIHFPEYPTLMPDNKKGELSTVDFVVSKNMFAISKPGVVFDLSSDHRPISFEIGVWSSVPKSFRVKNFKKTNWKTFRGVIENDLAVYSILPLPDSRESIDLEVASITKIISKAIDKSVPTCSPNRFRYPFSLEIQKLIKMRSYIRKSMKDLNLRLCRQKINEFNRKIKFLTKQMQADSWREKVETLQVHDQSLYQMTKKLKNKFVEISPLRDQKQELVFSDSEKANLLALTFANSHVISEIPTVHSILVQKSVDEISLSPVNFPNEERIRESELKELVDSLKPRKAAGADNVTNIAIKNLPKGMLERIQSLMNSCLKLAYFPLPWKVGKVIGILKPGKDAEQPISYRPITLESCLGKMFESFILRRMTEHCENNKVIINQQFGFRSQHSCPQQVMRLVDVASSRFNESKSTGVVLLDIEKAFDKVWHEALLHKLTVAKVPMYLTKIIESFLAERSSFIRIGNEQSQSYKIKAGVPQGSPLSPLLFNLFNNDIPKPKGCKLFIFADDAALTRSEPNYELADMISTLEDGLNEIKDHYDSWKVTINPRKTEAILLTKSPKMLTLSASNKIKFCDKEIEWAQSVRYLGVAIDNKLLFKKNIDTNISKAKGAMAKLYGLLKKNSGLATYEKLTLYRAYIRPILTYACPCFAHAAKTHLNKIQIVQNKCLRMALNARYRTRIKTLHKRAKIPLISDFITKLTKSFFENSANSDNQLIKGLGCRYKSVPKANMRHRVPRSSF
jgi:Reverse transcriptase (RNA-dependent DNA polymerase)/Endonuclease-reverse transcriptase